MDREYMEVVSRYDLCMVNCWKACAGFMHWNGANDFDTEVISSGILKHTLRTWKEEISTIPTEHVYLRPGRISSLGPP